MHFQPSLYFLRSSFTPKLLAASGAALLLGSAGLLHAQTDITALTTTTMVGTASTQTGVAGATSSTLSGNTYTLDFAGNAMGVSSYTAGGLTYTGGVQADAINIQRTTGTSGSNILWYRTPSATTSTTAINLVGGYISSQTVNGQTVGAQAIGFKTPNLNVGSDNFFSNQGNGSGNNNNVERLDSVFTNGIVASNAQTFAVFERGDVGAHDAFGIAAITSLDANGNPSGYGSLLAVTAGSYGKTSLGALNTAVLRNNAPGDGGEAIHPSAIANQVLGGVAISIISDLKIVAGTRIYGYSLFPSDVAASSTSAQLVNYNGFSTTTSDTIGGIDLTAYNGELFTAIQVPEPGTNALLALGLSGCVLVVLRHRGARA